ncbi:MAG: 30S ribosomal protein S2 [Verrucomicrobiaceae bacterium]|nr:MAG: 30S ribosomal protein S2 [Verrucomicrobiaceae bacterium]
MNTELLKDLIEAGVHFGHQTRKWHPGMKPFLLTTRNNVHIINLEETTKQVAAAADFLCDAAKAGKRILFVGCKRQAQDAVREAAETTGQFYVNHRWLGGTLTNFATIKKSISRLKYLETIEQQPEFKMMSKKELAALGREKAKLQRNLSGIRELSGPPDIMVIVDSHREGIAVAEGRRLGIPIVAMTDSNADPYQVNYPIASNDDAVRSIRIILQQLVVPLLATLEMAGRAPKKKAAAPEAAAATDAVAAA